MALASPSPYPSLKQALSFDSPPHPSHIVDPINLAKTSMSTPIVHLIDDDDSFLRASARLLRASGYMVKVYLRASDFLAEDLQSSHGCVISALNMPEMSGMELQETLGLRNITLPIIFITGNGDIPTTVSAIKKGAVDFLEKRAPKDRLIDAVNRALALNQQSLASRNHRIEQRNRLSKLSDREIQVLQHVVQGSMNKEIASALGIHERTVKLHRTAITSKLNLHSVAELTRLWIEIHGQDSHRH